MTGWRMLRTRRGWRWAQCDAETGTVAAGAELHVNLPKSMASTVTTTMSDAIRAVAEKSDQPSDVEQRIEDIRRALYGEGSDDELRRRIKAAKEALGR